MGADAVLIHMNTYGGQVDAADSMRTAILYNPIPVYVFIDNNAASAGALISIACKKIYMRKGANIGAATVVNPTGEAMPDKYQSYMRSMMRSTAEAHGQDTIVQKNDTLYKWKRDPLIAEAMVDERVAIPNLIDTGFDSPDGAYQIKEITKAINSLNDELKIPFSMFLSGYKYNEIAEKLCVPLGTVKSRIFFARQELQKVLKDFHRS